MVSKCRGIAEVSVMEVSHQATGIRTRARTAALSMADHHDSSLLSIKRRRKVRDTVPERNSGRPTPVEENSSSFSSDQACCSSNGSRSKLMDLEDDEREAAAGSMSTFSESRDTTLSNSNLSELEEESIMNSTENPSDAAQETNKKASAVQKPTKVELDEFFAEYDIAMKEKLNEITEKYNFNFMEDKPLEGLYDWVSLRP